MKSFFLLLSMFMMTFSSAYAHDRHDHRHRNNTDEVILGVIGGAIIGGLIVDNSRHRDRYDRYDRYENRRYRNYYRLDRYCITEQVVDRYGRVYNRLLCN